MGSMGPPRGPELGRQAEPVGGSAPREPPPPRRMTRPSTGARRPSNTPWSRAAQASWRRVARPRSDARTPAVFVIEMSNTSNAVTSQSWLGLPGTLRRSGHCPRARVESPEAHARRLASPSHLSTCRAGGRPAYGRVVLMPAPRRMVRDREGLVALRCLLLSCAKPNPRVPS